MNKNLLLRIISQEIILFNNFILTKYYKECIANRQTENAKPQKSKSSNKGTVSNKNFES